MPPAGGAELPGGAAEPGRRGRYAVRGALWHGDSRRGWGAVLRRRAERAGSVRGSGGCLRGAGSGERLDSGKSGGRGRRAGVRGGRWRDVQRGRAEGAVREGGAIKCWQAEAPAPPVSGPRLVEV